MKIIFISILTVISININAQGIFTWKTYEEKPLVVDWTPTGFSTLYQYGTGTGQYPYFLMIGADAITTFNLDLNQGAYVKFFIPPGIGKVTFGHNDATLAASQCLKHSFISEYSTSYIFPTNSNGSETWTWGCGSFNKDYYRNPVYINQESILYIGFYDMDNLNTGGIINIQDFSYTYFVEDTVAYFNWLFGTIGVTENMNKKNKLQILPNPVTDYLSVITENINEITFFDYTGKIVLNVLLNNTGTTTINISQFPSGIYFIQYIDIDGKINRKKLIKL